MNENEEKNCNCMEEKLKQELQDIMQPYTQVKDNLIPILNEVQMKYGYIPQTAQKEMMERLKQRLKIEEGETTPDGKFSIDSTRCVGTCGIAPVFTVNGEVYGRATVKKLDEVLDKLMK